MQNKTDELHYRAENRYEDKTLTPITGCRGNVKRRPKAVLCQTGLLCHQTVVLSIYDLTQPSIARWHPGEDLIFMFANLPLYLPVVTINTLLCLPEKCLKKQFVQVLYGLAWQYSWLMTAAKFRRRPGEFSSLICLGVLHLSIIPAWLYLCGVWTPLLWVFCSHSSLMRQCTTSGRGHLKGHFVEGCWDVVTPKQESV